jgi:hypothetical protein
VFFDSPVGVDARDAARCVSAIAPLTAARVSIWTGSLVLPRDVGVAVVLLALPSDASYRRVPLARAFTSERQHPHT